MPVFSSEFDQITLFYFFTNEKDKRGEWGHHNNLIKKKSDMTYDSGMGCKLECLHSAFHL